MAHAKHVLELYNSEEQKPERKVEGLRPIKEIEGLENDPSPLSVPWFDPRSIKKGLVGGEGGSHQPLIWIDTEKGIFYYQYHD